MVAKDSLATCERAPWDAGSQPSCVFESTQLEKLIQELWRLGYNVVGPTLSDGAIVYGTIHSVTNLPEGWTEEQSPGRYRVKRSPDHAFFGCSIGPQSWKKYLHPSLVRLWRAERHDSTFRILNNDAKPTLPKAFFGVRACDLAAIAVQDRVLLEDRYRDSVYAEQRAAACLIAVQCTQSAATCFCASMGTGPLVTTSADLILTELNGHGRHRFLARAGSELGKNLLEGLETGAATNTDLAEAQSLIDGATAGQVRSIDTEGIRDLLYRSFEHPRWEAVAARCLSCANCTMVCPTCFCTTVEDSTDVTGIHAERWRRWDSCFTQAFSYIHGGSVRTSGKARYRQWITHKLAAWIDQFGSSGCVGCGRCITWCPAGIDITEEARALCQGENHHGNA